MIKQETCINIKQFIVLNGHSIEKDFVKLIKKQLGKCYISNPYNAKHDIYLSYQDKYFKIEVKSGKRFRIQDGYYRNGRFVITLKDIMNKNDIFGFCIYNKINNYYFVSGKNLQYFFKNRNVVKYYHLGFRSFFHYLKPKLNIIDVIKNV
jgi:hypothetical protein